MDITDLSWLDELAPLQVPDDPPPKKRKRQRRTAAPPAASSPLKPTPTPRKAARNVGIGRSQRSTTAAAASRLSRKTEPPAATSHGQRGAHDQGERQQPEKTGGGQSRREPRKAERGPQVREQISDRHFLGALDGVNHIVQGPLQPPPPQRADIAEIIVIDSDTSQATDKAGKGAGRQKRGRTRAPPKTKAEAEMKKAETKPKTKPKMKTQNKPKAQSKPKTTVVKPVKEPAKKRVMRKTREASPSPLSSAPRPEHAEPTPTHVDRESSELNFVLPAHRLFVGRVLRSPFLFGTEGPWSAENLAWIEGRDLEEVRPKKWEPHFWQ